MDFSSGLPIEKEAVVDLAPEVDFWTENLLFTGYDRRTGIGLWLHLGTVPNDWTMWEDWLMMTLPGDEGVLKMWAYYRTDPTLRPGGANLSFKCIEPFRRWTLHFDGFAQHIAKEDMMAGLAPDGKRVRVRFDIEVTCTSPVWDAHSAAKGGLGKGGMELQSWAKEHYEQLWHGTGTIHIDKRDFAFDGAGWRDHSRGPRNAESWSADKWGGHVIVGAAFSSGRGLIFSRYWNAKGEINLEGACVVDADGTARYAALVEAPRLTDLRVGGEVLEAQIADGGVVHQLGMVTHASIWTSMMKQNAIGKDLSGRGLMYVVDFGECTLEGETGTLYLERSDPLNAPPAHLRPMAGEAAAAHAIPA